MNARIDIRRRSGGVLGAMMLLALLLAAPPAWAGWGSPVAVGEGELERPIGVAVDESSGTLYVGTRYDTSRLDAFNLMHELLPPSPFGSDASPHYAGTAFNPVSGHLYALSALEHKLDAIDPADGERLSAFEVPGSASNGEFAATEIASDGLGNVYVPEPENNRIGVFNEKGEAPSGGVAKVIEGTGEHALDKPTGVAVDPAGHVWVADTGDNRIEEFEASGGFMREIPSVEGVHAVAAQESGHVFASVFASSGPEVIEYDTSGAEIEAFGQGVIGEAQLEGTPEVNGITLDTAHHILYVADGGNNVVWAFTNGLPVATTASATNVTGSQGVLNGSVNPMGELLESCEFEYAPETEYRSAHVYGHKVPCTQTPAQIGSGTTPVAVSAEISGLEVDEFYHFRLHASNKSGDAVGSDRAFTAIAPVFGFQLGGPFALEMSVSNTGSEHEGEGGPANAEDPDMQAGSHPFDVTSRFVVNTESDGNAGPNLRPKDFYVNIPAGFAGSVARIPRCRMNELTQSQFRQVPSGCPTASQVGVVRILEGVNGRVSTGVLTPVYDMVPPPGVPAELGFAVITVGVPITFQLRSDGDYGITAKVPDISEVLPTIGSQLTLWGVPADPRHNAERFLPEHYQGGTPGQNGQPLPAGTPEVPFLTNPTRCGSQDEAMVSSDSWLHPGELAEDGRPLLGGEDWVSVSTPMFPEGIVGCGKLTFSPELEVKPETSMVDSPTGLTVDLRVPQSEGASNLATPSLKEARVSLPQGLAIAASQGRAREGCTPAQIKLHSMAAPECPGRSQVGKLEVVTPLLPEPLTGEVYLGSEREGNVFHVYLVIEGQGVLVKLEGAVEADEQTGQLTSTFKENPQLSFSELKLTFFGGGNASLVTPDACGSYDTTSLLKPWSDVPAPGEAQGTPDAEPGVEPFEITAGCAQGFAPGFHAGMEGPVAGSYSPFWLAVSRNDGEQEVSQVQVSLPKGLVGKLAGVQECSTAQIEHAEHNTGAAEKASPSCPAGSEIGMVQAGAGPGESLFYVPGKAYLTGPYKGAPYGVVVVVPALAGPFDLGTVVVRAAIHIDPRTAQVTVTTDTLPKMLDGIPLQVRKIEVAVNRPDFTINPTSCQASNVTGTLSSFAGAQHAVSARFQVGDCASLKFKPGFAVCTKARHTKRFGAFLHVKITSGPGQANIKSVLVKLPKQLPSRVSTLKGACSEKQYQENPAGCPAASRVGTAIAHTPILSAPLTGPAMFVSHGGAAFPDLDIVLQGAGITVQLEGNTNIKHNVTTSDFKSAPDVPINSFELTLPTGPRSALAANDNFCFKTVVHHKHKTKQRIKLIMPTTITGQNGAVVEQATHIAVEGCGKAAKRNRHKKK